MLKQILKYVSIILFSLFFLSLYSQTDTVRMQNNAFIEQTLEIETGTTVLWINDDVALHTVTSGVDCTPDGLFASGNMELNDEFSFTFTTAGSFPYYCVYHCTIGMTGTIIVSSVGIDEEAERSDIGVHKIGPVPSSGDVFIELFVEEPSTVDIALYDLKGMRVMTIEENRSFQAGEYRLEIPGSEMESGTYLCRIISDENIITRKIILF